MTDSARARRSPAVPAAGLYDFAAAPWLIAATLLAAAVAFRHIVAANTDVSWLLIAGERLLDGQKLYSGLLETNPPMAVLTYVPAILTARMTGLPAESILDALVLIAAVSSVAVTARILHGSALRAGIHVWPVIWLAIAMLTILPMQSFGQREHIATIELLPALAVLARRLAGERPPLWAIVVAGCGLGLALCFKPYFAVAFVAGVGILAFFARQWRLLLAPENGIAAFVLTAYGVMVLIVFPAYITVIGPLARDVYAPIGVPLATMLQHPPLLIAGLALATAIVAIRTRPNDPVARILIVMAVAFGAIYLLQRKGWPYHSYPMIVLSLLALSWTMLRSGIVGRRWTIGAAAAVFAGLFGYSAQWFNVGFDARPWQPVVARYGAHPVIMSVSGDAALSHPLVRALGGQWGSRQQNLLVASHQRYAEKMGLLDDASRALVAQHAARERRWFVEDFRASRPTIVLVDRLNGDWSDWIAADPQIAELLKDYDVAETFGGIDIMVPKRGSQ